MSNRPLRQPYLLCDTSAPLPAVTYRKSLILGFVDETEITLSDPYLRKPNSKQIINLGFYLNRKKNPQLRRSVELNKPCVVVAHGYEAMLSTAESMMIDIHDNVGRNMTRRGKKKKRLEAAEKGRNEKKGVREAKKASRGDGRVEPQKRNINRETDGVMGINWRRVSLSLNPPLPRRGVCACHARPNTPSARRSIDPRPSLTPYSTDSATPHAEGRNEGEMLLDKINTSMYGIMSKAYLKNFPKHYNKCFGKLLRQATRICKTFLFFSRKYRSFGNLGLSLSRKMGRVVIVVVVIYEHHSHCVITQSALLKQVRYMLQYLAMYLSQGEILCQKEQKAMTLIHHAYFNIHVIKLLFCRFYDEVRYYMAIHYYYYCTTRLPDRLERLGAGDKTDKSQDFLSHMIIKPEFITFWPSIIFLEEGVALACVFRTVFLNVKSPFATAIFVMRHECLSTSAVVTTCQHTLGPIGCEPVSRSGWVRFSVASSLFDPGKPVYEREIAFESRFGVAFPGKRRSLSSLLPPPPFAERASSSGGGLPRGFTTITQGWPDTHRRLAHDSFGNFAVRNAKSGTSE
ncbi:hypothetical protein EAG_15950 [Camponotus floridanus]|uniref:Uncharacterized protein n=1 Tax=Camponotus floridanus TaxID=104421 RepID=E1ZW08_CAMFO|nr:hypothetical protein EAG_15950 [Camponotus floridanus]